MKILQELEQINHLNGCEVNHTPLTELQMDIFETMYHLLTKDQLEVIEKNYGEKIFDLYESMKEDTGRCAECEKPTEKTYCSERCAISSMR